MFTIIAIAVWVIFGYYAWYIDIRDKQYLETEDALSFFIFPMLGLISLVMCIVAHKYFSSKNPFRRYRL